MKVRTSQRGSLLVEVIIVTVIFGIIGTGLLATLASSSISAKQGAEYVVASGYIKEGIEAVRSLRDQDWALVTNGTHGLTTTNGYYEFNGTSDTLDGGTYTRTITVEDVYRNGSLSGDIDVSGVLDDNTKRVTVNLAWDVLDGRPQNIDAVFYVTNWAILGWTQTLLSEFNLGNRNSTVVTNSSGGEVVLNTTNDDWSGVAPLYEMDLAGGGDIVSMVVDENADRLYTLASSTGGNDVTLIDISDVTDVTPTVIAGYEANNCFDIEVANGFLYLACNEVSTGAEVIILNGGTLVSVGTIDLPGSFNATAIAVSGNTLIIGQEEDAIIDEVHLYDITNPASPSALGSTDVGQSINDLGASTTHAFAVTDNDSQEVIAIQLSDYTVVDTLDLSGGDNANGIDVVGTNLYVVRDDGADSDFVLVDGSDPSGTGLSVTSSLEVSHNVNDVDIAPSGTWAALATNDNNEELVIVELSGFTIEETGDTSGSDNAQSVVIYGGYTYIGSESNSAEVSVLGVTAGGWGTPTLVGSADKAGNHDGEEIVVVGNRTYLATTNTNSGNELFVYDTTTPSTPVLLGSFNVGATVFGMDVVGNYAYLATSDNSRELDIIDVSTPSSMSRIGSYNASGGRNMLAVDVVGTVAFLGRDQSNQDEIWAIDVSTPSSPSLLDSLSYSSDINDVVVSGNYLYAATDNNSAEMAVFDISNPSAISYVTGVNSGGNNNAETIAITGSLVALGEAGGNELVLIDVSNPLSPGILSETNTGGSTEGSYFADSTTLYLSTVGGNLEAQRWDVGNTSLPAQDMVYDLNGHGSSVSSDGTYAYFATGNDSLELQILGPSTASFTDYVREGTFTSQAFDSGSTSTNWGSIEWTSSGTGTVQFMIRTANSEANLTTARWVGSDGTSSTTYTSSGQSITTDSSATGTQWVQWKVLLSGNSISTPVLQDVTLSY
jgi:type II secretory pathway pseudopilin PulG